MGTISDRRQSQKCSKISVQYKPNDAILIKNKDYEEVAKIIKFEDNSKFSVRKFIFAKKLKKLFEKQEEDYKKNEVVEDLSHDYIVDVKQVIHKCVLIYLDEDIEHSSFPDINYFCRFTIKGDQLFHVKPSALTEKSLNNHFNTLDYFKNKFNMGIENTPLTNNAHDYIEIHYENEIPPPPQRNSVKRDLNKSFGNSPSTANNSILNYSIVSGDKTDDELKITLKVSKKRNGQTNEHLTSPPKIRKSNRSKSRVSYVDYISPVKSSPNKRQRPVCRIESDGKITPRKQSRSENCSPAKREIRTPSRYNSELFTSYNRTPRVRRSLRLTSTETDSSPSTRRTNIRHAEDDLGVTRIGTNLDDSLRRHTLKVNLDKTKVIKNMIDTDDESDDDLKSNSNNKKTAPEYKVLNVSLKNLNLSNSCEEDSDESSFIDSESESTSKKSISANKTQKQLDTVKRKKIINNRPTPRKTPKTPKNRAKLIRDGMVTPSMHERSTKIKGDCTPLMKARTKLHVSYVPESLPCREKEYCDAYNFVESKLLDGCGGCMYVSGVPGTGKTATVTSVIRHLQESKNIPKFTFVNVNGMRLSEPRQSYVEILKQLKGVTLSWEQAQNTLEDMFVKQKKMTPTVMLIDELDILCTKRQDVVYNLLDWPTKAKNQLIVITIANTMDLPERLLMNRVTSRLGLTRLTFQAYTYKQLQEIVTKRLCGTNSFNSDAVQFVARKVASVSGDARRALDICRRAAEIAEASGKEQLVSMNHVNEALSAMITQPKVLAIKSCSRLEQLILQSTVAEVERTGVEETTFYEIYKMLTTCGGIEGFKMVSPTLAQSAMARLSACRLVLADQKCNNIYQKIILNVSVDDVYYALKRN